MGLSGRSGQLRQRCLDPLGPGGRRERGVPIERGSDLSLTRYNKSHRHCFDAAIREAKISTADEQLMMYPARTSEGIDGGPAHFSALASRSM